MLAARIGETLHPAWERTASLAIGKLQPALERAAEVSRESIGVAAFGLRLSAFAALVVCGWRMGNDLGVAQNFFISQGLFSHWQVWLALALSLHGGAGYLARRAPGPSDSEEE